ncbi:uncharacterized protein [Prorops nasuta]|uniref:uncharacterized protein isoform X1 n=1 Tax=Prorops nasuta TaxID=863751 RepID=UPI0034CFB40D
MVLTGKYDYVAFKQIEGFAETFVNTIISSVCSMDFYSSNISCLSGEATKSKANHFLWDQEVVAQQVAGQRGPVTRNSRKKEAYKCTSLRRSSYQTSRTFSTFFCSPAPYCMGNMGIQTNMSQSVQKLVISLSHHATQSLCNISNENHSGLRNVSTMLEIEVKTKIMMRNYRNLVLLL